MSTTPTPNAKLTDPRNLRAAVEAVTAEEQVDSAELELRRKVALLQKVRQTRERIDLNRSQLSGLKPNKEYVWVGRDDPRQVTFRGMQYEVCKDPDVQSPWKQEDGTHIRGDLILYQIDKELREAYRLDSEIQAIEILEHKTAGFLDFAERNEIPAAERKTRR